MWVNLQVSDPLGRESHSWGHCFISDQICWSTEPKQRKMCVSKFLRTALHVQSRSGEMKSGAGEDGWCEVMNRSELSSVWVIMGGGVVGKQPYCVNNEGGTLWRAEPSRRNLWIIKSRQLTNETENLNTLSPLERQEWRREVKTSSS